MAEISNSETLQPSLLDRLTDEEPHQRQESRNSRVLSVKRLREAVFRDVAWLLNTTNYVPLKELISYPEVGNSVLNYGLPDLTGRTVSSLNVEILERQIRQVIWDFEPRLLRHTVKVQVRAADSMNRNALSLNIQGYLWAEPVPLELFMVTEIDLGTGEFRVVDVS